MGGAAFGSAACAEDTSSNVGGEGRVSATPLASSLSGAGNEFATDSVRYIVNINEEDVQFISESSQRTLREACGTIPSSLRDFPCSFTSLVLSGKSRLGGVW